MRAGRSSLALLSFLASFAAVAACPSVLQAAPGAGTLSDPLRVDAFPYAIKGDTSVSVSNEIDAYDCAPATDESGPEIVYKFELSAPARVTAWVEGDTDVVDIDVQLLDGLNVMGGYATGCVARNNRIAEANMGAGVHYVTVDSWNGAAQAGPFVLRLEAIGDAWNDRQVAEGVVWRARRYVSQSGGPQVVHELVIDPKVPGVEVQAVQSNGCQTVGEMAAAAGAVAAINGGYFNVNTCAPVSLLKSNGMLLATNGVSRGSFGLDAVGVPMIAVIAAGQDWPDAKEAHGGGPTLAVGGAANNGAAAWAEEGFNDANFNGDNPRTIAGFDADGKVLFGTVDGRRANAKGMSLDALAAFAVSGEFGATDAVNLDGGGSTTMWVKDATYNGVVNYPSDDANQEVMTHPGSRKVSGGFFVFAPPYNHAPRFQTEPPAEAGIGEAYVYDADAIDLDVDDTVSFSLDAAPDGMVVDEATGVVEYTPVDGAPALADVTLVASDGKGGVSVQAFTLSVSGGTGEGGAGGGGARGRGGGRHRGRRWVWRGRARRRGGNGLSDGPVGPRRCSCRVPGEQGGGEMGALSGLLLAVAAFRRRRRS
ncbi:MAG: phosphodiester glycosidase family protein [Polyangiaceae bacterium]